MQSRSTVSVSSGVQPGMREGVDDDARAGLQVEELRRQLVAGCRAAGTAPARSPSRCRPRTCRPATNVALSPTPACCRGCRLDSSTMSGLNSTPTAARAALGRGDDVAAVARPEIHHEVLRRHLAPCRASSRPAPATSAPTRRPCPAGRRSACIDREQLPGALLRLRLRRRRQAQRHRRTHDSHQPHRLLPHVVSSVHRCCSPDLNRGASPLGLPYTLSRAPLRRRAPFAWLARFARSLAPFRFTARVAPGHSPAVCLGRK